MSFFDPPPVSPPPVGFVGPRPPAWAGPPTNVFGELVTDRLVLYRSASVAVALEHLRAYPGGFEFRIAVRSRHAATPGPTGVRRPGGPPVLTQRVVGMASGDELRLGLGFADGIRLTNLSPLAGVAEPLPPPLLVRQGAGFDPLAGRNDHRYWVWGLPPDGPLTAAVEVPGLDVPETTIDVDGSEIRRAAGRADVLWDDETAVPVVPSPQWDQRVVFAPEPRPTGALPEDEAAARQAVERAFTDLLAVEGDEVVNVEDGRGLASVVRELHQRFGGQAAGAAYHVDRVTFVDTAHAGVWFSVWLGPTPFLAGARGDAVLVDGRWRVARTTFCGLLSRGGVRCPEVSPRRR